MGFFFYSNGLLYRRERERKRKECPAMACARDSSRGGGWGCTRKCATNARGVGVHRKNEGSTAGFDPQSLKNFQTIPHFWSSTLCKWNFCLSGRNERRGKGFRRRKDMRRSSSSSSKGRREEGNNQWRTESKRRTSECRKGKEKGAGGGVALEYLLENAASAIWTA